VVHEGNGTKKIISHIHTLLNWNTSQLIYSIYNPILLFPNEVSLLLFDFMDARELAHVALTCRQYYWLTKEHLTAIKERNICLSTLSFLKLVGKGSIYNIFQHKLNMYISELFVS